MNDKMPRYLRPNVKIQYPNSAERDYYRVLRAIVRALLKYTNELLPGIKPALKQDAESDDIISEVTARFNNSRVREAALNEVRRIMGSVDNIAKQNMNKAFKNCLGVDVFMRNSELLEKITNEWYASQSQLINSIVSTYTDKLGTIISNAVQRGSLYKDVYADVKHLYDITDNRAKFIARNEIGNLNAITTKNRQKEAGINCYEWSTSRDERVRESHREKEGNLYYWNRSTPREINGRKVYPSPALHPGMDYNCRCVAIPIIDTESWNVANAMPDGQPVPNKATELLIIKEKPAELPNITIITDEIINQIKPIKFYGRSDSESNQIIEAHKKLLKYAKNNNNSNEAAFVWDNNFKGYAVQKGQRTNLEFKGEALKKIYLTKQSWVMHNHPGNSWFSNADIRFFMMTDEVQTLSVVTNQGKIEALTKTASYNKIKATAKIRKIYLENGKPTDNEGITKVLPKFIAWADRKGWIRWSK
nr:MAG TPA: Minor capsid component [Caudoviricetes sp.]